MKVSEGDRVMIVENNKLCKGTVKAAYELMSTAIVALDEGESRKVSLDALLPLYEEENESNEAAPTETKTITKREFWCSLYDMLIDLPKLKDVKSLIVTFSIDLMENLFKEGFTINISEEQCYESIEKIASPNMFASKAKRDTPTPMDIVGSAIMVSELKKIVKVLFPEK